MGDFASKHYRALAGIIRRARHQAQQTNDPDCSVSAGIRKHHGVGISILMERMIALFEDDNPNFDRHRFIDACYGKENDDGR